MQKFPLSANGFEGLQAELYKKTDLQLAETAKQINFDFIDWMNNHFELNEQQINHLKSLNPNLINQLSTQTAIAIRERLSIQLLKPEIKPVVGYGSKLIRSVSKVYELASYHDKYEAEGVLVIEISY
ncbi:hypothetical protein [Pedobacter mendelii]|uniref:Uncharacterized protein n=1 Tax=Pedobacter mendelii TaxID=1908240 RepID=A0ABQ2BLZ1_9SPHI|nr:hypothetical protein [Pedobacter mendelii]GGI29095.1 hypothetical protein GCM10008119_35920 [Pedobacter mendelii]